MTMRHMRIALDEAQAAAARGETPVGAVLVDPASGEVIATGRQRPDRRARPHGARRDCALRKAARKLGNYRLTGLTLLRHAGALRDVRRRDQPRPHRPLVFGAEDAKGGAVLHGPRFFEQPTCHWRPEVTGGVLGREAGDLLRGFFRERRKG